MKPKEKLTNQPIYRVLLNRIVKGGGSHSYYSLLEIELVRTKEGVEKRSLRQVDENS